MGGIQIPETRHVIRNKERRGREGGETRPVGEIKRKKKWYARAHHVHIDTQTHTYTQRERKMLISSRNMFTLKARPGGKKGRDEPQTA